jgi:hypothetical protein
MNAQTIWPDVLTTWTKYFVFLFQFLDLWVLILASDLSFHIYFIMYNVFQHSFEVQVIICAYMHLIWLDVEFLKFKLIFIRNSIL